MSTATATATTTMLRTAHNYRRQSDLAALADTHTHTQRQCVTINDNSVALHFPSTSTAVIPARPASSWIPFRANSLYFSALRHHLLLLTFALHLENWYGKTIFQQVTGLVPPPSSGLHPRGQPINHPPQLNWLKCWANTRRNSNFAFVCQMDEINRATKTSFKARY